MRRPFQREPEESAETPAEDEVVISSDDAIELEDQDFPKDPYEFIVSQEVHLEISSELWRRIAGRAAQLQASLEQPVEAGLREFYEKKGVHQNTLDRTVKKISSELAVYALVVARAASSRGFRSREDAIAHLAEGSLSMRSDFLDYIISEDGVIHDYVETQFYLMCDMREADDTAEATLMNLMRCCCRNHPGLLNQLHELYRQGIDKVDPRFKELREIMGANWRQPQGEQFSILQQYCQYLKDHPELFVEEFTEEVSTQEKDKKRRTIRSMAQFAIAAGGDEITPEAIKAMLQKTYERWEEFEDIQVAFDAFVAKQVEDANSKLSTIAGPSSSAKNIRSHRTSEDASRIAKNLSVNLLGERQHRRKRDRAVAKRMGSNSLPTMQELVAATDDPERVSIQHKLMTVRKMEAGVELVEAELEDVAAKFDTNDGNGLKADVEKILSFLQENPINPACSRIRSGNGNIVIDGKPYSLWRFAPNRCQGLSVHPSNRYMRVVYALVDNDLVIVDVLDHDSFDKKY